MLAVTPSTAFKPFCFWQPCIQPRCQNLVETPGGLGCDGDQPKVPRGHWGSILGIRIVLPAWNLSVDFVPEGEVVKFFKFIPINSFQMS